MTFVIYHCHLFGSRRERGWNCDLDPRLSPVPPRSATTLSLPVLEACCFRLPCPPAFISCSALASPSLSLPCLASPSAPPIFVLLTVPPPLWLCLPAHPQRADFPVPEAECGAGWGWELLLCVDWCHRRFMDSDLSWTHSVACLPFRSSLFSWSHIIQGSFFRPLSLSSSLCTLACRIPNG